jgi:2-keto-3-deoxy-6-phosphogluconate aldolase
MAAPYAHLGVEYFPLGGVNAGNMESYLTRPDVIAVGGSWIVSPDLVKRRDWAGMSQHRVLHAACEHSLNQSLAHSFDHTFIRT